jgi:hypothetical protein
MARVRRRGYKVQVRTCRECSCTDDRACDGGCWWVEVDLCSVCDNKAKEKKS